MKKTNKVALSLTIVALAAAVVFGPAGAVEAHDNDNGNGHGKEKKEMRHEKAFPGNSLWGRSHNPHFGQVMWGGQYENFDALIARLRALIESLRAHQGQVVQNNNVADVDVTTRAATSIDADSATLRGEINLRGENSAKVWFEYGTNVNSFTSTTTAVTVDDDDGDVVAFTRNVTGLNDDTRYYFRAVAEDVNGDHDYGVKLNFITNNNGSSTQDEPVATTNTAQNIATTSAKLRGDVDMNDFNNGVVFFVYGESESSVQDVDNDFDTYEDVNESGDALKKVRVDTDLDGTESYTADVTGLDGNTAHYFAIAVAYKDENGHDVIELGNIRNFTTE